MILKELKNKVLIRERAFTLIELLVVIAIIAILVVIVVVAINPAERIREAADNRAQANVRASGTLLNNCITRQNGNYNNCNSASEVETVTDGQLASTVNFDYEPAVGPTTAICVWEQGRTSSNATWFIYRVSDDGTNNNNQVKSLSAEPSANTCP